MQSVFTDVGKINFRDPSSYYLIPSVPGLAANSVASAAWLSSDGEALFALPSAAGGIFVIKLPPHDVPGKAASSHLLLCSAVQESLFQLWVWMGLGFVTFILWPCCTRSISSASASLLAVDVLLASAQRVFPVFLLFCKELFRLWS